MKDRLANLSLLFFCMSLVTLVTLASDDQAVSKQMEMSVPQLAGADQSEAVGADTNGHASSASGEKQQEVSDQVDKGEAFEKPDLMPSENKADSKQPTSATPDDGLSLPAVIGKDSGPSASQGAVNSDSSTEPGPEPSVDEVTSLGSENAETEAAEKAPGPANSEEDPATILRDEKVVDEFSTSTTEEESGLNEVKKNDVQDESTEPVLLEDSNNDPAKVDATSFTSGSVENGPSTELTEQSSPTETTVTQTDTMQGIKDQDIGEHLGKQGDQMTSPPPSSQPHSGRTTARLSVSAPKSPLPRPHTDKPEPTHDHAELIQPASHTKLSPALSPRDIKSVEASTTSTGSGVMPTLLCFVVQLLVVAGR